MLLHVAAFSKVLAPMHQLANMAAVVGYPAPRAQVAAVCDITRCVLALPEFGAVHPAGSPVAVDTTRRVLATGTPTGRQRGMHFMMAS